MQCISCGKDIPVVAKTCPYCHRDTKGASEVHGATYGLALLGGIVGYLFNDWIGALVGAVLIGGIGGAAVYLRAQSRYGDHAAKVAVVGDRPRRATDGEEREQVSSKAASKGVARAHIEPRGGKATSRTTAPAAGGQQLLVGFAALTVCAAAVYFLWPGSATKDAELQYTWEVQPGTIIVAADMTLTNRSKKTIDQVLTKCSVVAGGKSYDDHLEGGVLNGPLSPGATRTWRSLTLGSSPTFSDNVTGVRCRVSKVRYV